MTRKELEEKLDVDFSKPGSSKAENLLMDEIIKILSPLGVLGDKKRVLSYYIKKDIIGLQVKAVILKGKSFE